MAMFLEEDLGGEDADCVLTKGRKNIPAVLILAEGVNPGRVNGQSRYISLAFTTSSWQ